MYHRLSRLIQSSVFVLGLAAVPLAAGTVTITVAPLTGNRPISPLSFGGNEDYGPGQATVASTGAPGGHDTIPNAPYMRLGGNRLSSYNWENNADNAGADYGPHLSDLAMLYWVGATQNLNQAPALGVTGRYDQWRTLGKQVLATIQMMGWAAADAAGVVNAGQEPPSARWKQVLPLKGSAFTLDPNDNDAYVYMDEYVNFLVNRYGSAAAGGIKYYNLDNEPGAWDITHERAHPAHSTYVELLYKVTATASAILNVDPGAEVVGPAFWGYQDIRYLAGWSTPNAPDAATYNATYTWCANFLLDRVRQASTAQGRRLLHYFDFHYYPEALGSDGNRIIYGNQANSTTQACATARMQAPRSLWDPSYIENSWLTNNGTGPAFQLMPRLQTSISNYYPGTKLSISEYYFGADWDVSGGIAQADMLGVLARFDVAGNYWQLDNGAYSDESYTRAAFNLWLNYDGVGGKVGDILAQTDTSDWTATSAYSARSSTDGTRLWVVVLNKNYATTQPITVNLGLTGGQQATAVTARRFGVAGPALVAGATHSFGVNSISDTLPARSATVYIVTLNTPFSVPTPTRTPTYASPTVTPTSTPGPATELFDDFEDGNTANNWGGTWARYSGAASSVTLTVGAPGAPGSAVARAQVTANIGDFGGLTATFSGSPRNLTGYVGIEFMVRGSGTHWWQVATTGVTDGDHFGSTFTATGTWTKVTLLFSALNQRGFGAATTLNLLSSQYFQWASNANGAMNFEIDDVRLLTYSSATPTRTPTATPSRTRTATPSQTRSATRTPSPSPSLTQTATRSSTPSGTPSASRTATPSASTTPSPTNTVGVGSPTASATATSTRTPSATPSMTGSYTVSPTLTDTPFGSPTRSTSTTPSPTSTRSTSPTWSPTSTLGAGSPTVSPTRSTSPTLSPTSTLGVNSPTVSPTRSTSPTASPTSTFGANSPTVSPTLSTSPTRSTSPTGSTSPTPSLTGTLTVNSPTVTSSPTSTLGAGSPTEAPTRSPSLTATRTVSSLPSPTATPSLTATRTVSPPPSPTATPSLTATRTVSSLPSPTASPSLTSTLTLTPLPPAPSATATPETSGPLVIDAALAWPNPGPRNILVKLAGPAGRVTLKVYTPAWVLVGREESGPLGKGWSRLALPAALALAPQGLYYFVVQAHDAGRVSRPVTGRLYHLK